MVTEINMFREGVSHAGEQEDLLHLFVLTSSAKNPHKPQKTAVNHLSLSLSWRSRTSLEEEEVDGRKCIRKNRFARRPKTVNNTPLSFSLF
jgi:hypothetical protein